MLNVTQLRLAAREIFFEALRAVDAGTAVRDSVRLEGSNLTIAGSSLQPTHQQPFYSIAMGKAAMAMAGALEDVIGDKLVAGIIAGPSLTSMATLLTRSSNSRWQYFEGGHPLPNQNSLAAAREAFALLERANRERAVVIFLISGGGSAMIEWPIDDQITLEDLRAANEALVACGASISEINSVRRAFSAVKGGRLAALARDCEQVTLIVSDVPKDEEQNVASGPTLTPPSDSPEAKEVISRYGLSGELPASILRTIEKPLGEPAPWPPEYSVILDNDTALEAAASGAGRRGFKVEIARDISDEPIEAGCKNLVDRLMTGRDSVVRTCVVSGGEFACPVRGDGIGGRNLETALRIAIAAEDKSERAGEFVALCAGTDGIDGNSPAAGAIVDSTTINRARKIGLDPEDFLNRSDAYSFFVALGDAITTGATGTNVRDIRILLSG